MANIYVRSTDGNNADNGSTWALAVADLATAAGLDAAGDTIYVSQAHAESTTGSTCSWSGTAASPSRIVCANDGAAPPTSGSTAGTVASTTVGNISFSGFFSMFGLAFSSGSGTNVNTISLGTTTNGRTYFENCDFKINSTGSTGAVQFTATAASTKLKNCRVKFSHSGQGLKLSNSNRMEIDGLSLISGGTSPTALFVAPTTTGRSAVNASRVDLTNASAGVHIFTAGGHALNIIRNSKLPASWSGSLVTGTLVTNERHEMHNCDSGDTNYRFWIEDYAGSAKSETTIVRTGGASDGATLLSAKVATSANAKYPYLTMDISERAIWNSTIGSSQTAEVEILHFAQGAGTNGALQNDEIWLDVEHLGTSGSPLGLLASGAAADQFATPASHTSTSSSWDSLASAYSSGTNYVVGDIVKPSTPNGAIYQVTTDAGTTAAEPTWGTTDGLTTTDAAGRVWTRSNRQKLTATFTAQELGPLLWKVRQAKASKTVYVDLKVGGVT